MSEVVLATNNTDSGDTLKREGTNPLYALALIIIISALMVTVSFIIFLNSSAFDTVKQIKAGMNSSTKTDLSGYDTTSPIKPSELDSYTNNLDSRLNSLDDEYDFGQGGISENQVGL